MKAKHLAATAVMIEMGVTPSFLASHNGAFGLRQLPALEPNYVAPTPTAPTSEDNEAVGVNGAPQNGTIHDFIARAQAEALGNSSNMNINKLKEFCLKWHMEAPLYQVST